MQWRVQMENSIHVNCDLGNRHFARIYMVPERKREMIVSEVDFIDLE